MVSKVVTFYCDGTLEVHAWIYDFTSLMQFIRETDALSVIFQ